MFITYRIFDILAYYIVSIISGLVGKRFIYGGFIFAYSSSLLLHKFVIENPITYKFHSISYLLPASLFIILIGLSLYVLNRTTEISDKQKLLSIVFLILSLVHSIVRNISKNEIFKTTITKYISTLLFIVVLFTVSFIPDNQIILKSKYNEIKEKGRNF